MSPIANPLVEIFMPTVMLAIFLLFFHRSKIRGRLFSHGIIRSIMASAGIIVFVLLYWQLTVWAFFFTYSRVANKFGHQAVGTSWDIGLTYTLSLSLILQLLLASIYVLWSTWSSVRR